MYGRKGFKRKRSQKGLRRPLRKRYRDGSGYGYPSSAYRLRPAYKSWPSSNAITRQIGHSGAIVPDRLFTKLKYTQVLQGGAASFLRQVFRGNSVFDPDFTGGGNQPAGFDQLATLYAYYRVYWSTCKVTFQSTGSATPPGMMSLYPSNSSSPFSIGLGSSLSASYAKTANIWVNETNPKSNRVSNYMSTPKIWGELDAQDSVYASAVTTNPSASWYWVCDAVTLDGSNFGTGAFWTYEITYGVCFEARQTLGLS